MLMANLLKKLRRLKSKRKKRKASPFESGEEGSLVRMWNRLRKRVAVPNEALNSMQELYEWAKKYEEKFGSSENEEDKYTAKLFSAVKKRAFSEDFFGAAQTIVGVREKTPVKSYKRRLKIIEKKYARPTKLGKPKLKSPRFKKRLIIKPKIKVKRVKAYVRSRPKRFTIYEKLKIAQMKSQGVPTRNIVSEFSHRTYSSVATEISRMKKAFGDWKSAVKSLSETAKNAK